MFEVVYYGKAEPRRWLFAARFDDRAAADAKADELRLAGYDARVIDGEPEPEGDPWRETDEHLGFDADHRDPKQYCRHGTFIGSWWGPDYLCGACEMGEPA